MAESRSGRSPLGGYSPGQDDAIGGYAALMSVFAGLCALFAAWFRQSNRELPERLDTSDLVLTSIATHKAARLITKDRVTSPVRAPFTRYEGPSGPNEVDELPRGRGLRHAIGELLTCPYCLGMWIAATFTAGLVTAPRPTRLVASVLATLTGSDVLQIAYKKAEDSL